MKQGMLLIMLIMLSSVAAGGELALFVPQCTLPGVNVAHNPGASIVVCDDPQDSTCEQDFATLCPVGYDLCTADQYNAGNDNWDGTVTERMLGEIHCRGQNIDSGAGHYSIWTKDVPYSVDVPDNDIAGSSIPGVCESNYGCNEQWYYALCCAEDVPEDDGGDIPEFTAIGAGLALLGAAGLVAFRKRK